VSPTTDLASHAWWLASRASGLIALALITISVGLGLALSGRITKRPGLPRTLNAIHEQTAVTALVALVVHGLTLLGDPWLNPGVSGISVPFTMAYRPLWTGLGIVGGYMAAILGLSFYVRRRIGPRLWRKAHRFMIVVYGLAVVHTIGAGTDASAPWMRVWLYVTTPVIATLFVARMVSSIRLGRRPAAAERLPHHRPARETGVVRPRFSEDPA
jgi:methionine sulfoxide reductase heme-binding subunit